MSITSLGSMAQLKQKGTNDSVKVYVRVRPFNPSEIEASGGDISQSCTLEAVSDTLISSINPNGQERQQFPFDRVFWSIPSSQVPSSVSFANQEEVFRYLGLPTLESSFEGYNACIFAYGQTSSGKTYTMQGYGEDVGVIPRLCKELFNRVHDAEDDTRNLSHSTKDKRKVRFKVSLSYLEIYNEKIKDLLKKSSDDKGLEIHYDPKLGPVVKGLDVRSVTSWHEVEQLMEAGFRQRSTASTAMNEHSSRSHAIVQVSILQTELVGVVGDKEIRKERRSRINLVDLAGSEKVKKSLVEGKELKEAININMSLTNLGRVIDKLVTREQHIPYRDSALTYLLSDSLGGNSRTTMLAALSPAIINFEETLSTLRYASRTRQIVNVVKVNEDASAALIRDLQAEVSRLRESMGQEFPDGSIVKTEEVEVLQQQLQETETVIETLRVRERQEKEESERREKQWEVERKELEEKHQDELAVMQSRAEELIKNQEALLEKQQVLEGDIHERRKSGVLDKLRFLSGIAAAKAQKQEALEKQEQAKKQLIVARLRAASTKAKLEQALQDKEAQAALEAEIGEGNGPIKGPICEMCQRRAAKFKCPECEGEIYCHLCDAAQHRAQRRGSHQRHPILLLDGAMACDMCGERAAVFQCSECEGDYFCELCDVMKHKSAKRSSHVRTRDFVTTNNQSLEPLLSSEVETNQFSKVENTIENVIHHSPVKLYTESTENKRSPSIGISGSPRPYEDMYTNDVPLMDAQYPRVTPNTNYTFPTGPSVVPSQFVHNAQPNTNLPQTHMVSTAYNINPAAISQALSSGVFQGPQLAQPRYAQRRRSGADVPRGPTNPVQPTVQPTHIPVTHPATVLPRKSQSMPDSLNRLPGYSTTQNHMSYNNPPATQRSTTPVAQVPGVPQQQPRSVSPVVQAYYPPTAKPYPQAQPQPQTYQPNSARAYPNVNPVQNTNTSPRLTNSHSYSHVSQLPSNTHSQWPQTTPRQPVNVQVHPQQRQGLYVQQQRHSISYS